MTKKYSISVLGGDGTGPEVIEQAMKVVSNTQKKFDIDVSFREINIGGDRYLKTGELVTEEDIGELRESDAILLGAIGHPDVKPGILEQGILLNLRKKLDQQIKKYGTKNSVNMTMVLRCNCQLPVRLISFSLK